MRHCETVEGSDVFVLMTRQVTRSIGRRRRDERQAAKSNPLRKEDGGRKIRLHSLEEGKTTNLGQATESDVRD